MQEWISSPIGMHPVESGQWVLAADAYAERDRLAAENAELRSDAIRDAGIECRLKAELAAANATLERLREAVPKVLPLHMSWRDSLDGARAILYPETLSIRDTAAAHDHARSKG